MSRLLEAKKPFLLLLSHHSPPFDGGIALKKITDTERILDNGIVDSMTMVELIAYVEKNYHIQIETKDLTTENFSSIDSIAKLVTQLRGK